MPRRPGGPSSAPANPYTPARTAGATWQRLLDSVGLRVEDLRKLILNAVVWSGKLKVPRDGVKTTLPDLAQFEPAAVEPRSPAGK